MIISMIEEQRCGRCMEQCCGTGRKIEYGIEGDECMFDLYSEESELHR